MLLTALLPLVGGAVLALLKLRSNSSRLILTELITVATSLCVVLCLVLKDVQTVTLLEYGGPFSIAFGVDSTGRVLLALIAFLWPFAILYTNEYMEHEERPDSFCGFYIMTYGIMVLLCCARNMFTMYIAYELLTIVTLPLVWHKKDRESIHAARDYVCYSIGAAAMGFMALIIVAYYGGGDFETGSAMLAGMPSALMQTAFMLGFFGFGVKATVFPLSNWLPRACAAPTPVTALLHAVAVVNAGVFAVLRLTYFVFDPIVLNGTTAQYIAITASICTVLYGAIMAVRIRHVKRKLAFSTISNLGYMLLGISLMSASGMTGALMHMICHSFMKITLFFCIGAIMCKTERAYMPEMHGMARVMPKVFFVFVIAAIALMGIPPFCGFASKFTLLSAAIEGGNMWTYCGAISLLISSVLTAIYSLSVLIPAYTLPLEKAEELPVPKCDPSWRMLLPLFVLIVMIIVIGMSPLPIMNYLKSAASVVKEVL